MSVLGRLQRGTGFLESSVHQSHSTLGHKHADSIVVIVVSLFILMVGVISAALAPLYSTSSPVGQIASVTLSMLLVVMTAIIPRGQSRTGAAYSLTRKILCELFRAVSVVAGLCASATPLSVDNDVACAASVCATFISFVYSRLDDSKRHHWSHLTASTVELPSKCCATACKRLLGAKLAGAAWLVIAMVPLAVLAVAAQPALNKAHTLIFIELFVLLVPACTFAFDLLRDRRDMSILGAAFAVMFCTVSFGLALVLIWAPLPGVARSLCAIVSCWLSVAGIPVGSALLTMWFAQVDSAASLENHSRSAPLVHAAGAMSLRVPGLGTVSNSGTGSSGHASAELAEPGRHYGATWIQRAAPLVPARASMADAIMNPDQYASLPGGPS